MVKNIPVNDSRIDESHLKGSRRAKYCEAITGIFECMGPNTNREAGEYVASRDREPRKVESGPFSLLEVATGRTYPLRVGINSIGRFDSNDVVVDDQSVSRRHCIIVVHTNDTCELRDTASLNGTWTRGRMVLKETLESGQAFFTSQLEFVLLGDTADSPIFVDAKPANHGI